MANTPAAPTTPSPMDATVTPDMQAPSRPPDIAPGGPANHKVWNDQNNGISMVDAFTAKKLQEAGVPTDDMAELESMKHPRITHDGWVPQVKGWEAPTAAFLSGVADWGSFGLSGLLNTGLAKAGAFHDNSVGIAKMQAANNENEPLAHGIGAATSFLGSIAAGGLASGAAKVAGEGAAEAGGQAVTALTKAQVASHVAQVLAPGAVLGLSEETNREINFEDHIDPWQIAASGALMSGIGGIIHGGVELGAVPLIKAAKPKIGGFLSQLRKAYETTEGKWVTEKVEKSAEEIAAGEAAMNKPYVSQTKETKYTGGVKTNDSEEIAREIVTLTQKGMAPEEAADTVAKEHIEKGKAARGKVKVTYKRSQKNVNTEGENVNVKNVATDDDGNVTTTTKNTGNKSTSTEQESRVGKKNATSMELDGDFDSVGRKEPVEADSAKHPAEMSEKELLKHIDDNGGFEHPDNADHVKEMFAREKDKDTVKSGIAKAADHYNETAIGNRLVSHQIDGDEPLTVHFDPNETQDGKLRKLGEWYEKLLSPEDNALHKEGQSLARQYTQSGDTELHDQWAQINAYLTKKYPRARLPNGDVQPSFRDLGNVYRRVKNYTNSEDMLRFTGSVKDEPHVKIGGDGKGPAGTELPKFEQPWTTNEKRTFERATEDTRQKVETTTKYPKPPKFSRYNTRVRYEPGVVKPHLDKAGAATTFLAAHWIDKAVPGLGSAIRGMVGMDYAIAAVLNKRATIGKVMLNYGTKTARLTGVALKALTRHERDYLQDLGRQKLGIKSRYDIGFDEIKPNDVAHTDQMYANVQAATDRIHSNPTVLSNFVQQTVGDAMPPNILRDYLQKSLATAQAMQTQLVKDPRPPSLQSTPYNPPHSVKLKVLRDYHALVNPLEALQNPTPQRINLIESVHPELMQQFRTGLIGALTDPKLKLTPMQAQKISVIMGSPVTPRNDPAYIKRLQQTSADAPDQDQAAGAQVGKGAGNVNGKPSAKIASKVPLMYDPNPNVNNLQG